MTSPRSDDPLFLISRTFNASLTDVWQAWSEPVRFAQWWGPKGCTLKLQTMAFEEGCTLHYAMQWPGVPDMWGKFVYDRITPQRCLSYVSSFSNAAGDITRAPFPGMDDWPLEVLNTVTLTEQDGHTTLTLRGTPVRANDAERAMFAGFFDSLTQGFGGTLDQLALHLAAPV